MPEAVTLERWLTLQEQPQQPTYTLEQVVIAVQPIMKMFAGFRVEKDTLRSLLDKVTRRWRLHGGPSAREVLKLLITNRLVHISQRYVYVPIFWIRLDLVLALIEGGEKNATGKYLD